MKVLLNGELKSLNENSKLKNVLDQFVINQKGIAVAVNEEVIAQTDWAAFELNNNDSILIITATQGG